MIAERQAGHAQNTLESTLICTLNSNVGSGVDTEPDGTTGIV